MDTTIHEVTKAKLRGGRIEAGRIAAGPFEQQAARANNAQRGLDRQPTPASSELEREQVLLLESVATLERMVNTLQERVRPLLLKNVVSAAIGGGAVDKDRECYSEYGQNIFDARAGIRQTCERLSDLLNALAI